MMRPRLQPAYFRSLPTLAALILLAVPVRVSAQAFLTIGDGWALVREVRTVSLTRGVQTLLLDDLPPEIDLSTLIVRTRRVEIDLQAWGRRTAAEPPAGAGDDIVTWTPAPRPGRSEPAPGRGVVVEAQLSAPDERRSIDLELLYRTSGMSWSANYEVVVRGDRVEEREPLSADLTGWIRIRNRTGRTFSNAVVRLVGRRRPPQDDVKPPGFLILDEFNPMSDPWRWRPPEPEIEYEYALPQTVQCASGSDMEYVLVRSERIPAARRYILRAEEVVASLARPLRKYILVANTSANRLGVNLPPGPVQIFLGSMRSQFLQAGDLPHTPMDGEIRMDLGPAGEVTGRRVRKSRELLSGGDYAETFLLDVANSRDGAITVELDEKPPLILEWTLTRSTKPCREVFRRLQFEFDVPAGAREVVEYSLRVKQPSR